MIDFRLQQPRDYVALDEVVSGVMYGRELQCVWGLEFTLQFELALLRSVRQLGPHHGHGGIGGQFGSLERDAMLVGRESQLRRHQGQLVRAIQVWGGRGLCQGKRVRRQCIVSHGCAASRGSREHCLCKNPARQTQSQEENYENKAFHQRRQESTFI